MAAILANEVNLRMKATAKQNEGLVEGDLRIKIDVVRIKITITISLPPCFT